MKVILIILLSLNISFARRLSNNDIRFFIHKKLKVPINTITIRYNRKHSGKAKGFTYKFGKKVRWNYNGHHIMYIYNIPFLIER